MNERGFFTLIGLCFLIVAAILADGVQKSEGNYYSVADDFLTAAELQNIADSALNEAVDMIKSGEVTLKMTNRFSVANRSENQHQIFEKTVGDINVKTFYEYGKYIDRNKEYGNILLKEKIYPSRDIVDRYSENNQRKGVIIISVASRDSDKIDSKIYRRAIAYFFTDEDKETPTTIYFMNSLDD